MKQNAFKSIPFVLFMGLASCSFSEKDESSEDDTGRNVNSSASAKVESAAPDAGLSLVGADSCVKGAIVNIPACNLSGVRTSPEMKTVRTADGGFAYTADIKYQGSSQLTVDFRANGVTGNSNRSCVDHVPVEVTAWIFEGDYTVYNFPGNTELGPCGGEVRITTDGIRIITNNNETINNSHVDTVTGHWDSDASAGVLVTASPLCSPLQVNIDKHLRVHATTADANESCLDISVSADSPFYWELTVITEIGGIGVEYRPFAIAGAPLEGGEPPGDLIGVRLTNLLPIKSFCITRDGFGASVGANTPEGGYNGTWGLTARERDGTYIGQCRVGVERHIVKE